MAEPQERPTTAHSTVASCSATDCTYNENRECHAGEIRVASVARVPVMGSERSVTHSLLLVDVERSGDRHVAVIPEGPYVVPKYVAAG